MALDATQLQVATEALLCQARKDGGLNELTVRKIRQMLEEKLSLPSGTLEAKEFKTVIKDTIVAKLTESCDQGNTQDEQPSKSTSEVPLKTKAQKGNKKERKGVEKRKRKSAQADESSADESEPVAEKSTLRNGSSSPPKENLTKEKPKKKPRISKAKKPESNKFKSKAIIDSSENEEEAQQPRSPARAQKEDKPVKVSPAKRKSLSPTKKTTTKTKLIENGNQEPVASSSTLTDPASHSKKVDAEDGAESDLSLVVDEPPKKRQKKVKDTEKGDSQKPKRGKKPKEPLSKDEEMVTKLKAIIVACGVRKAWKKEFQGLEKPKQQIKRLHDILAELGMTPRYTMEKAKAIREKREFQQELQDVQEYERAQRKKESKRRGSVSDDGEPSESDDALVKTKKTARASIQAFLDDQSEEEQN